MTEANRLFADGAAYERLMGRWSYRVGEAFLDWLGVPQGARWLDVGCGNGAFTEALIACCEPAEVIAIDPSEGQLAYARKRPRAQTATFQVGDAHALPFLNGTFDAAVMALVISFLSNPPKAVSEMARVVKPNGWVAAYFWDSLGGGLPLEPIRAAMDSLGMTSRRSLSSSVLSTQSVRTLWEMAGLHSVETHAIHIPIVFCDFDDFWESTTQPVGPIGKTIQRMMPIRRERLRLRLREQLTGHSAGQIAYQAHAGAIKGRV